MVGLVRVIVATSPPVVAPRWEKLPVKLLVAAPEGRLTVKDPVVVLFSGLLRASCRGQRASWAYGDGREERQACESNKPA